jgi:hypothetical protein
MLTCVRYEFLLSLRAHSSTLSDGNLPAVQTWFASGRRGYLIGDSCVERLSSPALDSPGIG